MVESLGDYKILDRIGAGGMGEVFRARDTRLGRTVAIKVIGPQIADDPGRRERFLEEARAAATLSHPNIAALYEIGEDQGQLFLVFEFVPGESLKTVIGGRPLNPRRAIDLAVQVADALADAQAGGIVHRDIKPASIMVTPKGNAKILDFGLSTWTAGGAEREHAAEGGDDHGDSSGNGAGLGGVHVARTGARRAARPPHRHLLSGHRHVRDAHRQATVLRPDAGRARAADRAGAGAAALVDEPGAADRAGRDCRQSAREEPRAALRIVGDAGG